MKSLTTILSSTGRHKILLPVMLVAMTMLIGCEGGVTATDSGRTNSGDTESDEAVGGSLTGTSFDTIADINGDGRIDDFDLVNRPEAFVTFVPPPELGFAHPEGENIQLGRWGDVIDWPQVATGAANLPDGRILTWSSPVLDGFRSRETFTHASVFDPTDSSFIDATNPSHNMFCSGLARLPDGEIFSNGGGSVVKTTSIFSNDAWSGDIPMTTNRWYNNSTLLPSGQVLTALGADSFSQPEVWTAGQGWNLMPNIDMPMIADDPTASIRTRDWFPALSVAPDGTLFHAGPTSQLLSFDMNEINGVTSHGSREVGDTHRLYNTTVMYDIGKILVAGGGEPAESSALTIDLNAGAPSVAATNSMTFARAMQNSVVLPNGEVLVIGGTSEGRQFSDAGTTLVPEIWNPDTGVWRSVAPHEKPRNYHSTAVLMKDARVAAMGGGLCDSCSINQQNGEIYEPPYLFEPSGIRATRPTITQGPAEAAAGNTVSVTGSNNIVEFNMVRLVALTHHHTADQRFIPLDFQNNGAGNYAVDLPANTNVLIPGYYWLFALDNNGVPSIGHSIKINVTAPELSATPGAAAPGASNDDEVFYEYFEGDWDALPDFDTLTPVLTGTQSSISLEPATRQDFYGFRFTTQIDLPAAGEYTFYLSSDDGSRIAINGQTVVDYDGLHAAKEVRTGTISLSAGVQQVVVTFFEKSGLDSLLVDVAGPQLPRTALSNITISPSPANLIDAVGNAVSFEYYEGNWNVLPDFDALTPVLTGQQDDFSLAPATSEDFYGFRFTTQIDLPATGEYTFYLRSDDGSVITVNDQVVVDNDGLHGSRLRAASVNLQAGTQQVVVTFFEKTGRDLLSVEIEGPQLDRTALSNIAVSPSPANLIDPVGNAVSFEYYEGNWNVLPDFDTLTPVLTGQQDNFSLAPATSEDFYGFRFTTQIDLPATGEYTFYLRSDDGSVITVNDQVVVDNDGVHGSRLRAASVNLPAGTQQVVVTFFEKTGLDLLSVEIEGPQLARTSLANLVVPPR